MRRLALGNPTGLRIEDQVRWLVKSMQAVERNSRLDENDGVERTIAATADRTLLASDSGKFYHNEGATTRIDYALPPATVDLEFEFLNIDGDGSRIVADGTDTIQVSLGVSTAGGYTEATALGAYIHLRCYATGKWVAKYTVPTWTVA
jgi:hypothetical protein